MPAIGADLPPHLLAKRKRQEEADAENAPVTASGAKRSPSTEKRRKIIGPAMPPAPLDERPEQPAITTQEESSDEDDDFGPALSTEGTNTKTQNEDEETGDTEPTGVKLQRDDWMTMPPKQDDLAARLDPTKQRPKAFNTGKGARGPNPGGDDSSTWHETPEQKHKRLRDEMMGVAKPATSSSSGTEAGQTRRDAAHRHIQEHNSTLGPTLLDQHKSTLGASASDDDPSKRAFDREKDMSSSARITSSQKREMLSKAAGFSGKFSGGNYL